MFDIIHYKSDYSAKESIPKIRMSNQKYIMYTSESSQMDIVPPMINELYLLYRGAFKNYVDKKGWVGGHSNVYAYRVNDVFLFTLLVYEGWVGVQKCPKFCLHSY